jgi:hypothetical protein
MAASGPQMSAAAIHARQGFDPASFDNPHTVVDSCTVEYPIFAPVSLLRTRGLALPQNSGRDDSALA